MNYRKPDQALPVTEHAKALRYRCCKGSHTTKSPSEPGRYIVGNAGILLTQVLYRKVGGEKKFVIVDAGMNDLIRPTLYEAYHFIWPTKPSAKNVPRERNEDTIPADGETVDVVGPICESGDYLAKGIARSPHNQAGLSGITWPSSPPGAYGFAMSSNYNNRPRAPPKCWSKETNTASSAAEYFSV